MVETPTANQEALDYLQEHWEEMMEVVPDGMCCAFSTDFRRLVAWGADTREASERAASMGENAPRLLWKPDLDQILA